MGAGNRNLSLVGPDTPKLSNLTAVNGSGHFNPSIVGLG